MTHNFIDAIFTIQWLIVSDYYYAMDITWVKFIPHVITLFKSITMFRGTDNIPQIFSTSNLNNAMVGETHNKRVVVSKKFTSPLNIDTQLSNVIKQCGAIRDWHSRLLCSNR